MSSSIQIDESVTEKVTFEIAIGGSMCKARALMITTHTGLNFAADSFITGCYAGALGGCIVLVVDDPAIQISKNGEDSRFYALHGLIPLFEPFFYRRFEKYVERSI